MHLHLEPSPDHWPALLDPPRGELLGASQQHWRELTRSELNLDVTRPIIATGHQTLLWHPGILAKYLAAVAFADAHDLATANLIVDQHADDFGSFEVPAVGPDGESLTARTIELTTPRKGVPMALHEPFTPPRPPRDWRAPIKSVKVGGQRIFDAVNAHRDAPNAALQMAAALSDLMQRWVPPLPAVTSTALMTTSLARDLLEHMAADPHTCAEHYNEAVRQFRGAGVTELLIRDDYVELPVWRIRPDGRRMRAYDNDIERWLEDPMFSGRRPRRPERASEVAATEAQVGGLMPRALLLTALVRLGMCDLFIHGTGGAVYDRAMELWIERWLGVRVSNIAVVSATLRLPLRTDVDEPSNPAVALQRARRGWHDPVSLNPDRAGAPSDRKKAWLDRINAAPRKSPERRAEFLAMHRWLESRRQNHAAALADLQTHARRARQTRAAQTLTHRRDWPFPLYPIQMIDELREAIGREIGSQKHSVGHE